MQFIIPKKEIVSKFIASYIFEPNVALLTEDLISTSNTEENLDICENVLTQNHDLIGTQYFDAFVKLKLCLLLKMILSELAGFLT